MLFIFIKNSVWDNFCDDCQVRKVECTLYVYFCQIVYYPGLMETQPGLINIEKCTYCVYWDYVHWQYDGSRSGW